MIKSVCIWIHINAIVFANAKKEIQYILYIQQKGLGITLFLLRYNEVRNQELNGKHVHTLLNYLSEYYFIEYLPTYSQFNILI